VSEGIPHCMRAEVWQYLAGVQDVYQPNEYQRLIDQASDSSALPAATVHLFDVIERDLGRCYPDHVLFVDPNGPGQRELRNILRAYALHNPDVGYCQGMGRLVGLMLITGLAPEAAFWLLTALLSHTLKGYYTPTLFQLRVHAASFGVLLREHDPYLHRHIIEKCQVEPLTFMTNWFLTAYTMALPWHLALRVWDWMILRGPKVLFRVGIGML
ncbi:RabGAP/TBC, partial [Ramicandelaber brevisporus]